MPTTPRDRRPTFTEQARRTQLLEVTVALVAEHGYQGTSLARIAERAEITKAAVLYHFPSKNALVEAAYAEVLGGLVTAVAAAVEAVPAADGPAAYVRTMIGHLREHPRHTRMIVEAMIHAPGPAENRGSQARWGPLAQLLAEAHAARARDGATEGGQGNDQAGYDAGAEDDAPSKDQDGAETGPRESAVGWRTAAVVIGGGIDAIVSESLEDPGYDTAAAAELLVAVVERSIL